MLSRLRSYWVDQAVWWRSRSLDWWAAHITVFYVAGAFMVMGARFDELLLLKLSEIGDLSAGIFGPVAFLWLVLGYIQQGRELRLSSEALQLQAQELSNSVAQQCEMVAAQKTNLQNYERSLEPLLHLVVSNAGWDDEEFCVGLTVSNTGSYCEALVVRLFGPDNDVRRFDADPLINGAAAVVRFNNVNEWADFNVVVEYMKISGESNSQSFSLVHHNEPGYGDSYIVRKNAFLG